jgi:acyl-coenzyme A synthetase/AMP-(fatty) acid ligase/pimeloyl-ACP methyl ester carboxylesterase
VSRARPSSAPLPRLGALPGLDPAWSRLIEVIDADGVSRRWHVLDNRVDPVAGTMLCVHGNPTWSYLWRRFLAEAPRGWRVVAVDQLSMGFSEGTPRARTLARRIDDLGRVVAELELAGQVVVVAHDWGGPIALGWAEEHAAQVAGVILANTGISVPSGKAAPLLIRLARSPLLRELVCVRTPIFVSAAAWLSRPPLPADVRRSLRAPYGSAARRRAIGDFVADIPLEADHPSRGALESVAAGVRRFREVPVLMLWGPRDPVFTQDSLRDLMTRLPHADVQRYAGASHLVTEDAVSAATDAWRWVAHLGAGDGSATAAPLESELAAPVDAALRNRADDASLAVAELSGDGVRTTSFAELAQRVEALAHGLSGIGVEPGHRVAMLIRPGLDLTSAVYACWRVGAAIVVADFGLGLRRMADALHSADPDWVIGIPAGLAAAAAFRVPGRRVVVGQLPEGLRRALRVEHALDEFIAEGARVLHRRPDAELEAAVLFTSGATGPPKGVVYRHRQLAAQLELVRTVCDIRPGDGLVAAFAPFALYGPALGIGAAVPDMDVTRPGTLTATALADAAAAAEATLIFASPAALRNVVATEDRLNSDQRRALSRIRLMLSAGAPVPLALLRAVQDVLPNAELHTPYGMTECLPVSDISLAEIEAAGPGNGVCVGRPLQGVRLRISALDALGRARGGPTDAIEVTGEVCVAAAHVKDRYDRLWAAEQTSSRDPGWHRTGDVGHLDAAGRLWIEGRLVHLIATAEGPFTPVGIELRIEQLPEIAGAAVVGVGPLGTQQVVAIVVPSAAGTGKSDRPSTSRDRLAAARRSQQSFFRTWRADPLAEPALAAAVRAAAGVPLAAVMVTHALPVDIRHASKIDRTRLARWADRVLSGGPGGRP